MSSVASARSPGARVRAGGLPRYSAGLEVARADAVAEAVRERHAQQRIRLRCAADVQDAGAHPQRAVGPGSPVTPHWRN